MGSSYRQHTWPYITRSLKVWFICILYYEVRSPSASPIPAPFVFLGVARHTAIMTSQDDGETVASKRDVLNCIIQSKPVRRQLERLKLFCSIGLEKTCAIHVVHEHYGLLLISCPMRPLKGTYDMEHFPSSTQQVDEKRALSTDSRSYAWHDIYQWGFELTLE